MIAIDLDEQATTAIIIDKWGRGALINIKTIAYGSFIIIVALIHFAAALRADLISFRAYVATVAENATLGKTTDDNFFINIDEQRCIERTLEFSKLS